MRFFQLGLLCCALLIACNRDDDGDDGKKLPSCTNSDPFKLQVDTSYFILPNAFTPNGDGINDAFRAVFRGIDTGDFSIKVSDGSNTVFSSESPDFSWEPIGYGTSRTDFDVQLRVVTLSRTATEGCARITIPRINPVERCAEYIGGLFFLSQFDPATGNFLYPSGEEECP